MTTAYREADLRDLPAICALGQVVNLLHHEAWPSIFAPPSDPSRDAAHWERSIGQPGATTFVAEHAGEVIAFATVTVVDESNPRLQPMRYAHVGSIGVALDFRGQGIGKQLMVLAEQWAVGRGAKDVRLNVWTFNDSALAFYQELGYEVRALFLGRRLA